MNDDLTLWIRKSFRMLFINNPVGTSLGVFLGVVLNGLYGFFLPSLKIVAGNFFAWDKLGHVFWIFLSVFGFNYKNIKEKDRVDPKIINSLNLVDDAVKKGVISQGQAKIEYLKIIKSAIDSATVKKENDLNQIEQTED